MPESARAQDKGDEPEEKVDDATRYLELANDAYKRKDYERAVEYWQHANRLAPNPMLYSNIGFALVELERYAEALEALESFLEKATEAPEELRQQARKEILVLEKKVGVIVIDANVEGASVTLDAKEIGATPLERPIRVDPGDHRIEITKDGYRPFRRLKTVASGRTVRVEAKLLPAPKPPPVEVERPVVRRRSFFSRHKGSSLLAAGAVMLAGAGTGLGLWTWSDYKDLARTCGGTLEGCSDDEIDGAKRKALYTNIAFGAAGAAALTSVVLFLLEDSPAKSERRVTIVPTRDGAAVLVRY